MTESLIEIIDKLGLPIIVAFLLVTTVWLNIRVQMHTHERIEEARRELESHAIEKRKNTDSDDAPDAWILGDDGEIVEVKHEHS